MKHFRKSNYIKKRKNEWNKQTMRIKFRLRKLLLEDVFLNCRFKCLTMNSTSTEWGVVKITRRPLSTVPGITWDRNKWILSSIGIENGSARNTIDAESTFLLPITFFELCWMIWSESIDAVDLLRGRAGKSAAAAFSKNPFVALARQTSLTLITSASSNDVFKDSLSLYSYYFRALKTRLLGSFCWQVLNSPKVLTRLTNLLNLGWADK